MTDPHRQEIDASARRAAAWWNLAALTVAVAASGGSLYLSLGLGLKACPLCFYQRSFALAAVLVMGLQLWLDGLRSARACLAALPLAVSGLGVAATHVKLVLSGKLECPVGLFGWGDAPSQSLAVFTALTLCCWGGAWSQRRVEPRGGWPALGAAVLLGLGTAWVCLAGAPPLPPAPSQPYDPVQQPFDMCRPPYRGG